ENLSTKLKNLASCPIFQTGDMISMSLTRMLPLILQQPGILLSHRRTVLENPTNIVPVLAECVKKQAPAHFRNILYSDCIQPTIPSTTVPTTLHSNETVDENVTTQMIEGFVLDGEEFNTLINETISFNQTPYSYLQAQQYLSKINTSQYSARMTNTNIFGWETRFDQTYKRIFYVDHHTLLVTWISPTAYHLGERIQWYVQTTVEHRVSSPSKYRTNLPTMIDLESDTPSAEALFKYDITEWEGLHQMQALDNSMDSLTLNGAWYMCSDQQNRAYFINSESKILQLNSQLVKDVQSLRILLAVNTTTGQLNLEIQSDHFFQSSYDLIMKMEPFELRRKMFTVILPTNEEMTQKEKNDFWFVQLHEKMLEMKLLSKHEAYYDLIGSEVPDVYFRFLGRLMAMSIYYSVRFPLKFPIFYYRILFNKELTLNLLELKYFDIDNFNKAKQKTDKPVAEILQRYFAKPIKLQMMQIRQGLNEVIPIEWMEHLNTEDIEKMISGFCTVHEMERARQQEETSLVQMATVDTKSIDTNIQSNEDNKSSTVDVVVKTRCCTIL
ncbi:unnamed protein product, partial [Adineta ricciae]